MYLIRNAGMPDQMPILMKIQRYYLCPMSLSNPTVKISSCGPFLFRYPILVHVALINAYSSGLLEKSENPSQGLTSVCQKIYFKRCEFGWNITKIPTIEILSSTQKQSGENQLLLLSHANFHLIQTSLNCQLWKYCFQMCQLHLCSQDFDSAVLSAIAQSNSQPSMISFEEQDLQLAALI